jgi:single-stranded DNA-binding protein
VLGKYAKKGSKIAVGGSIELRNYEDNKGVKHTAVDIVATDIEFLSAKPQSDNDNDSGKRGLIPMDDDGDIPF